MKKTNGLVIRQDNASIMDDEDVDCFGNYDARELLTCQRCGMKEECEISTKSLAQGTAGYRHITERNVAAEKSSLNGEQKVVDLMKRMKEKEQTAKVPVVKKKPKIVAAESEVPQAEQDEDGLIDHSEDAAPKRKRAEVVVISDTVFPESFSLLYQELKKSSTPNYKKSVTSFQDEHGIFVTVTKNCRTEDNLEVFVNGSKDRDFQETENLKFKRHNRGEKILIVSSAKESQKEALAFIQGWREERAAG